EDKKQDDNIDGWLDMRDGMSENELEEQVDENIQPIRLVLVKLCKSVFAIKNSSTLLLPQWKVILDELELVCRIMLHDVTTHWNSTFDMLNFALKYCSALNTITG
ncbi:hypothetical protein CPC08DRAFT_620238, partial [Agrocybe pediades]